MSVCEINRSLDRHGVVMSKKELKSKQGQRGEGLKLHYSELTANELKIIGVLAKPGRPTLTIKELVVACKWKGLGKARANSRVRNTLRRLVRSTWVEHPEDIGDGLYRLSSSAAGRLRRLKPAKKEARARAS
jgi:hypothetical protein